VSDGAIWLATAGGAEAAGAAAVSRAAQGRNIKLRMIHLPFWAMESYGEPQDHGHPPAVERQS
jgi:hypothetical protein